MLPRILVLCLFLMGSAMAAEPIANFSVTFTPKDGAPLTAEAPRVLLIAPTTIPLDIPGGLRLIEIAPQQEVDNGPRTLLRITLRDPGVILPGHPGGGNSPAYPPQALAIAQALVKLETDKAIVFLKSPTGTWSVKVSLVAGP